ncbi:hypothetical protein LPJ56_000668 [Coemansia sp. RSA 2599]|nr:hypothetical protein LPJ75_000352 [Coemansia sp. RSA 2598]KAJ1829068.1 hypothetical protein LPJ56_000668 [Coemansia sp. RSA 2599]
MLPTSRNILCNTARRLAPKRRTTPQRSTISTVEAGTAYENTVIGIFRRLGATLERVGGASDRGIDFRGNWHLPNKPPFYVVGQCKNYERKKIGPSVIREWEGVMARQEVDTLGIVAATSGFTRSGIDAALSSRFPVALATIDWRDMTTDPPMSAPASVFKGAVRGFVWNRAADAFIGRMMVAKKHYDVRVHDLEDPAEFTIQLLWDGQPLVM